MQIKEFRGRVAEGERKTVLAISAGVRGQQGDPLYSLNKRLFASSTPEAPGMQPYNDSVLADRGVTIEPPSGGMLVEVAHGPTTLADILTLCGHGNKGARSVAVIEGLANSD